MEENRPDPELLLKKLRKEEEKREKEQRGKLKIFLGYAAGVGKTYAMLEAAQTLRDRGEEVVLSPMTARLLWLWQRGWKRFLPLWLNIKASV